MKHTPVAVFAFNRPEHLRATLQKLAENIGALQTDVTIFCDGPRSVADEKGIAGVRQIANSTSIRNAFASLHIIDRDKNMGLARSIIEGVSFMLKKNERVIVLEDDLITSRHFLKYMNGALNLYANESQVTCVHGYSYPIASTDLPETYFLLGGDCWGWATWRRAWSYFNPDGKALLHELEERKLTKAFDVDGSFAFVEMLRHQIEGKNNSWAIRWRASTFLKGGLTLYPRQSLVVNIGMDGSGTHCGPSTLYDVGLSDVNPLLEPQPLAQCDIAFQRLKAHFLNSESQAPPPLQARRIDKVKRLLKSSLRKLGVIG